ncbi:MULTISPECIES: sensor histidine kinase [unclassified Amycolatopsis]|uniref:sensor histidine kinase n=1 Tax=unclassified Amycolatopsis TaxID=2618356 RepID=UPI00106EC6A5|nr:MULTISPECIES: histidine kinase [unclassified Amycolatopsis]MCG3752762.1 two-component sensor histidine kinase [Amycolatopsis sp. Poz14]
MTSTCRPWPRSTDWFWLAGTALVFACLDFGLFLAAGPATGFLGPYATLVLELVCDASLLLLARFPNGVAGLLIVASLAMLASDLFSPGLLVPVRQPTLMTVPTITPIVLAQLVRQLDRRRLLWIAGFLALLATRPWNPAWNTTPFGLLSTALPVAISLYFEARRQLLSSLRDRAERAEREQHLLAEQALAAERRRLASEMHDVVTHRLSLMVLHAGALGVTSPDPSVKSAAEDIRREGAHALDELRDLVGVLRNGTGIEPPVPNPPLPGEVADLVAESVAVGIATELSVTGDRTSVSPTVARTAYRVVQEALTNIRKHAPGCSATVSLRYHPGGLDVAVANTRATRPPDAALAGSGSGAGLSGLRQRVELVGGTFEAGPVPGGGFKIGAILPAYVPTTEGAAR